ncbi:hypothetical protein AGDE_00686 [Angomonas deanei]|uniref:AAA+ ATPase domain-containing protein n=1 Tax=Angomonas deanei TaxID=59799 RepID=A0A7G2CLT7_9TRYP|nr:hypothetical protein AGDE_00686 [Angomonas deanei]CAD2220385.1 hypothetical protein, conserved [Angomonas deanei]|eukprot:EPY43236.1 hypothetical protein AGDE_00686 [Angomonas deanei]
MTHTRPFRVWRFSILLLLVSSVLVSVRAAPASHRERILASQACPAPPLCEGSRLSAAHIKYCNPLSATAVRFFRFTTNKLSSAVSHAPHTKTEYRPLQLPFPTDAVIRKNAKRNVEEYLKNYLAGQEHLLSPITRLVQYKVDHPTEPLVLHLAGDNGVGKTFTAKLISLALSLYCGAEGRDTLPCAHGDALLIVACSSLRTLPVAQAREIVVTQVLEFAVVHPHGVVLLDDLSALHPELIQGLSPLFGRAPYFPEQLLKEDKKEKLVSLSNLLVIITTDFGKQGVTIGKSLDEIKALVDKDFASLYGSLLTAHIYTFPYLAFNEQMGMEMIRHKISQLSCVPGHFLSSWFHLEEDEALRSILARSRVTASWMEEDAAKFLIDLHRPLWEASENGRSIEKNIIQLELWNTLRTGLKTLYHHLGLSQRFEVFRQLEIVFYLREETATVAVRINGIAVDEIQAQAEAKQAEEGDFVGKKKVFLIIKKISRKWDCYIVDFETKNSIFFLLLFFLFHKKIIKLKKKKWPPRKVCSS